MGWMGAAPIGPDEAAAMSRARGLRISPTHPTEDPADGCPGGWIRSAFALSVLPFVRIRTEGGGRNPNLLLERADDDLLIQWVQTFEAEQERWEAWRWEQQSAHG